MSDHSILLFDSVLRIAKHWNAEYCLDAADAGAGGGGGAGAGGGGIGAAGGIAYGISGTSGDGGIGIDATGTTGNEHYHPTHSLLPYSPVLYCALNLAAMNFGALATSLPRQIRVHVSSSASAAASAASQLGTTNQHIISTSSSSPTPVYTTASTSALFMSKFSKSLCPLLRACVIEVMTVTGLGARYPGEQKQAMR